MTIGNVMVAVKGTIHPHDMAQVAAFFQEVAVETTLFPEQAP